MVRPPLLLPASQPISRSSLVVCAGSEYSRQLEDIDAQSTARRQPDLIDTVVDCGAPFRSADEFERRSEARHFNESNSFAVSILYEKIRSPSGMAARRVNNLANKVRSKQRLHLFRTRRSALGVAQLHPRKNGDTVVSQRDGHPTLEVDWGVGRFSPARSATILQSGTPA